MKIRLIAAAALALASGLAQADGSYGYANGTALAPVPGAVTAAANVNMSINVPRVIVLRVGAATTTSSVDFTITPTIPTGTNVPTTGAADSQSVNWTGAAPSLAANTPTGIGAWLWHNNNGNANLTCSATLPASIGLSAADIEVSTSTAVGGNALPHPGGASASVGTCGTASTLARNTLYNSTWAYTLNTTNLGTANPGYWTFTIQYTATTL